MAVNTISILGGTGKEGKGLGYRWAKAGYRVLIGSRQIEKAQNAADEINKLVGGAANVLGLDNRQAAEQAEVVVLTVPYTAQQMVLESVKDNLLGKILINVTVPLVPPRVSVVQLPSGGSAAMEAQTFLGSEVQVVAAFQNISYENLLRDEELECDVLVCGGNKAGREIVLELIKVAGMVGWDAGPVENSVVVEGLTSILIGLNKRYGVRSSGIRITGINRTELP